MACGCVAGGGFKKSGEPVGLPLVMGGAPGLWTTVVTIIILTRPFQEEKRAVQWGDIVERRYRVLLAQAEPHFRLRARTILLFLGRI